MFSSVLAGEPDCLFLDRENETAAGQLIAYRQIIEMVQMRAVFMAHVIAQSWAGVKCTAMLHRCNGQIVRLVYQKLTRWADSGHKAWRKVKRR